MPKATRNERARVERTQSREASKRLAISSDSPFRILILGDFSGRDSREAREGAGLGNGLVPISVDRDNFDELPERLGVAARIQLAEGGPFLELPIRRLDDFHPDRLFDQMAAFRLLRRTRRELLDPETFESAAREVRSWEGPAEESESGSGSESETESESEAESQALVAGMLERAEAGVDAATGTDFDRFVQAIVKPHLVPADPPDRDDLIRRVDETIGSWMRSILHHPRFQGLEALWRGLAFLVERLDSRDVAIHVLDVSRDELAEDLRSSAGPAKSRIARLLVGTGTGSDRPEAWSLFLGMYTFGPGVDDIAMLGRLAKVASAAGAPFLAAASPERIGRASFADRSPDVAAVGDDSPEKALWGALRDLPEAAWIALALPRFLLRLPYGAATDPIEGFPFEEIVDEEADGDLLWGNSALACACLIAQARQSEGRSFRPGAVREIDGLPVYIAAFRREGGGEGDHRARTVACAETILSDRDTAAILDDGLIAVLSVSGRDAIRVPRFQSIANPPRPLAGVWDEAAG